jgi:steroid delta-isomerase-like uncharacterized protein
MTPLDQALREKRHAIVMEHMTAENAYEFERCISAFSHPRYEIVPTGEVWDGHDGVNALLLQNKTAFPDFKFSPSAMHYADDAVLVEGRFSGTHAGPWRGLPATGRTIDFPLIIVFVFDGERMICERTYFDLGTLLRQLGVGRDPNSLAGRVTTMLNHPLTVSGAYLRQLFRR